MATSNFDSPNFKISFLLGEIHGIKINYCLSLLLLCKMQVDVNSILLDMHF